MQFYLKSEESHSVLEMTDWEHKSNSQPRNVVLSW